MIIFYIMLVTIAGTDGKSRLTDRCPSSILQWKRQESLFSCPADAPYHCILKYNTSQLYEACIATVTIGPGVAGCPWILFHQGVPIHGSRNSECPISNPECPPANHNGYLSNQLYQYPACFMQRSARSSHGYDIITSELPRTVKDGTSNHTPEMEDANESQRNIYIALGLSVLVVVIVILSVAFCLFKRVCRSHEGSSKRNVNEEDESTDMINKGQLIPEKAAAGENNVLVNQEPQQSSNTAIEYNKSRQQRSKESSSVKTAIGYNESRQQRSKESSSVKNEDVGDLTTDKEDTKEISQIESKAATSNTKTVIQRFLQPTSDEKESNDWSDEDETDTSPILQNEPTVNCGEGRDNVLQQAMPNGQEKVGNEDYRKDSKEASTSNTKTVIQRSLQPTTDEKESTDWSDGDEKDTSPLLQNEPAVNYGEGRDNVLKQAVPNGQAKICNEDNRKDSKEALQNEPTVNCGGGSDNVLQQAEPNGQKKVRNEDNRKKSKEAVSNGLTNVCNEDNRKESKEDDTKTDPTCSKELNLNHHTVTLYEREDSDEDVVQRIFRSILEVSDGVVSYQQLLNHVVEKEYGSTIQWNLENILKGNRNVFRLLGGDFICFVIAYLPEVDICKNYSPSSIRGECADPNCAKFHICTFYMKGVCKKPHCRFSHTYGDAHNMKVKVRLHLENYTDSDINTIIRNKYPKICISSCCDVEDDCPYLHICSKFCYGKCIHGLKCRFGHDFKTEHNVWILKAYGISEEEMSSGSPIAMKLTIAKRTESKTWMF